MSSGLLAITVPQSSASSHTPSPFPFSLFLSLYHVSEYHSMDSLQAFVSLPDPSSPGLCCSMLSSSCCAAIDSLVLSCSPSSACPLPPSFQESLLLTCFFFFWPGTRISPSPCLQRYLLLPQIQLLSSGLHRSCLLLPHSSC